MFSVQPMGLGKQIERYRKKAGLTLEKLEELSGVAVGTIHALEKRDSSRSQFFPAIARAFGLTVEQLGDEHADYPVRIRTLGDNENYETPAFSRGPSTAMEPILSWEHESDLPPGEFVMIRRLDVRLSAGHGITQPQQLTIEFSDQQPQAFRADWIRRERLKPKKLASMTADGDSMEDRIHHGDALVIDTSQTEVKDGKVYALWYDGGERVKRLYRLPGGGLRIHSDNSTKYPDVTVSPGELEHVRIIGRVVHTAGTGGL